MNLTRHTWPTDRSWELWAGERTDFCDSRLPPQGLPAVEVEWLSRIELNRGVGTSPTKERIARRRVFRFGTFRIGREDTRRMEIGVSRNLLGPAIV